MRRRLWLFTITVFTSFNSFAQISLSEAVKRITGAESLETVDPYEMERLEELAENPLRINFVTLAKMEEAGLMTHYQAVSLIDYRSRHGDILSLSELAAVDGFGSDAATRLAPFISLECHASPFERRDDSLRFRHDLTVRTGLKKGMTMSYGMKYRLQAADRVSGAFAFSHGYASPSMKPESYSGNIMLYSGNGKGALVIGDYNARFGQGLALWNGMSMSGIANPSSLMKRPAGISASSSYTGNYSFKGAAGYLAFRKFRLSALTAFDSSDNGVGLLTGANAAFVFRKGQASVTHYSDMKFGNDESTLSDMKTAADFSCCLDGKDMFSELSYDWLSGTAAFLGGTVFPIGDDFKAGAVVRLYPPSYSSSRSASIRSLTKASDEYAMGVGTEWAAGKWVTLRGHSGFGSSVRRHISSTVLDFSRHTVSKGEEENGSIQIKARTDWAVMISDAWKMTLRLTERVRTWGKPFRTEARVDMTFDCGKLAATLRTDLVRCKKTGMLSFLEGAYVEEKSALYLRLGIFCADDWDDRIYAYERDAPGSFNVPAYYGRGAWTSLMLKWTFSRWGKVYLRTSMLSYALMKEKKPGKAELKLQMEFNL